MKNQSKLNEYTHPFSRLQAYADLASNQEGNRLYDIEYGCTIRCLSLILNIPIEVVRFDIAESAYLTTPNIISFIEFESEQSIKNYLIFINELLAEASMDSINREDLAYNESSIIGILEENDKKKSHKEINKQIKDLIMSGSADDYPFAYESIPAGTLSIPISHSEAQAYNHLLNNYIAVEQDISPIIYRDNYLRMKNIENISNTILEIQSAIAAKRILHFLYKANTGIFEADIIPIKLLYDSFENSYAILGLYDNKPFTYRIERIVGNVKTGNKISGQIYTPFLSYAPQVWGFDFNAKPIKVKIKIYDEGTVIRKIKLDLACRTQGRLYEKDNAYYYEDTVYGYNSFKKWIRSYGSSIVVIKPLKLRNEMIDTFKSIIENN